MAAGYQVKRAIAAATANATLVTTVPTSICGWQMYNAAAYPVFVKLYNSATIPTAGAGTPVMTIGLVAAIATNVDLGAAGIYFDAGFGFTITKLVADADTTVLVAADCVVNIFYK